MKYVSKKHFDSAQNMDMTEGSLWKKILLFSMPLMASQQMCIRDSHRCDVFHHAAHGVKRLSGALHHAACAHGLGIVCGNTDAHYGAHHDRSRGNSRRSLHLFICHKK